LRGGGYAMEMPMGGSVRRSMQRMSCAERPRGMPRAMLKKTGQI
jgi:hypothetical protein